MAWLCSCVPQALIKLTGDPVTGQALGHRARPSGRACGVARVLGVRHLVQAGLTAAGPAQLSRVSSVALGLGRRWMCCMPRRWWGWVRWTGGRGGLALADAAVETTLAMAGAAAAATRSHSAVH